MSDIKLFTIAENNVTELAGKSAKLEKDLKFLIDSNMEIFLGVRFLATEYSTGKTHKGRIDSLGIDENNCPVIIEYKRHSNENVINQGLFYLTWLLDHKAEFKWLVMEKLGKDVADSIEWGGARLICMAENFNKYDEHAIQQIDRNIDLMHYRYFGDNLLLLDLVNAQNAGVKSQQEMASDSDQVPAGTKQQCTDKTQVQRLTEASPALIALFDELSSYTLQLGDEVQRKDLKLYTAFKRIKNFLSVVLMPQKDARLLLFLKLPGERAEENSFSRNVTNIGHWGTGNLEVAVRNLEDLEKAKALILESYSLN